MDTIFRIDARRHRDKIDAALDGDIVESLSEFYEPTEFTYDSDLAKRLIARAMEGKGAREEVDPWLAPRVHMLLRLPRSAAADSGIWAWLALTSFRDYMRWRWPKKADSGYWRYQSADILRNGVSRLWWAAEMVRNGPDYTLTASALATVRTFQNVGELRYSWNREAARAFTRAVRDAGKNNGDELSVAFNAALATHSLELVDSASDSGPGTSWDPVWAAKSPSFDDLTRPDAELIGPAAGFADPDVEARLYDWLIEINEKIATAAAS